MFYILHKIVAFRYKQKYKQKFVQLFKKETLAYKTLAKWADTIL